MEVLFIVYTERRLWGTLFTPINALALPFTVIVLVLQLVPSSMGFVPFYFSSLFVWMGGLACMAIPSWILAYGFRKRFGEPVMKLKPLKNERLLLIFTFLLIVPFVFKLRSMMSLSLIQLGSDEFGEGFATYGIFGHLLHILFALSILCFVCVRRDNKWLPTFAIVLIAAIAFLNQVRSWVIIPVLAGIWLCLVSNRLKLSLRLILIAGIAGIAIFVGSYLVMFIIGYGHAYDAHMSEYIVDHTYHYIFSGVLGMSEDMRMGILETPDPDILFSPFVNAINSFTGEAYISPINPHYLEINVNNNLGDNVRTFFGTMYIHTPIALFAVLCGLFSVILYLIRIAALRTQSTFIGAIDAWFCALLAMGWFEYYLFHVSTFEIPAILLLLFIIDKHFVSPPKINHDNDYSS